MRLIDADALLKSPFKWLDGTCLVIPVHQIEIAPTIETEPVVYGKWQWDENAVDWGIGAWVCSECHSTNDNIHAKKDENPLFWKGSQRCPVCGAKMNRKGK